MIEPRIQSDIYHILDLLFIHYMKSFFPRLKSYVVNKEADVY